MEEQAKLLGMPLGHFFKLPLSGLRGSCLGRFFRGFYEGHPRLAGEEDRLKGVSIRYMPNNFVVAEARVALALARNLGSRFLFTSMSLRRCNVGQL